MRQPSSRVFAFLIVGCVTGLAHAQPTTPLSLDSPDGRIHVRISAGDYAVVFRACNEGIAYRFETSLPAAEVTCR